jgi:hypothetical protein
MPVLSANLHSIACGGFPKRGTTILIWENLAELQVLPAIRAHLQAKFHRFQHGNWAAPSSRIQKVNPRSTPHKHTQ